jgi:hypothetical protein
MHQGNTSLQTTWLKALLAALFCYASFGKGFSYLFIGEMLAVIGFLIFLQTNRIMLVASDRVLLIWGIFALWGTCRTIPFITTYHFDALRDAALWGYGIFALTIAAFVNKKSQIVAALKTYRKFLHLYLPIVAVIMLVSIGFSGMPKVPWSNNVGIISLKAGDASVHLAAAGLFYLIFPNRKAGSAAGDVSVFGVVRFIGWLMGAIVVLVVTRGGFSAMAIPIGLVSFLRPTRVGLKAVGFAVIGAALGLLVLESNVITLSHHGRKFNSDAVTQNIGSILGGSQGSAEREGNKTFRIVWWTKIVGYTVFGPYRWTGKGFGINLAQSDNPPGITAQDTSLRSPHNGVDDCAGAYGSPWNPPVGGIERNVCHQLVSGA